MWRRFSSSSESTSKDPHPPPAPSTTAVARQKPAKSQQQNPALKPVVPAIQDHDLPVQRPAGAGQRRRSSILERLTRESTKEGIYTFRF